MSDLSGLTIAQLVIVWIAGLIPVAACGRILAVVCARPLTNWFNAARNARPGPKHLARPASGPGSAVSAAARAQPRPAASWWGDPNMLEQAAAA